MNSEKVLYINTIAEIEALLSKDTVEEFKGFSEFMRVNFGVPETLQSNIIRDQNDIAQFFRDTERREKKEEDGSYQESIKFYGLELNDYLTKDQWLKDVEISNIKNDDKNNFKSNLKKTLLESEPEVDLMHFDADFEKFFALVQQQSVLEGLNTCLKGPEHSWNANSREKYKYNAQIGARKERKKITFNRDNDKFVARMELMIESITLIENEEKEINLDLNTTLATEVSFVGDSPSLSFEIHYDKDLLPAHPLRGGIEEARKLQQGFLKSILQAIKNFLLKFLPRHSPPPLETLVFSQETKGGEELSGSKARGPK